MSGVEGQELRLSVRTELTMVYGGRMKCWQCDSRGHRLAAAVSLEG